MAQSTKGRDDLVCDENDVIGAAQLLAAAEVARRRHDAAAGAHDGLVTNMTNSFELMKIELKLNLELN